MEKNKKKKSTKGVKTNVKIKFKDKHPKAALTIKVIILIILLLLVIGSGILIGYIYGAFGEDFTITAEELSIGESNSIIVDKDGNTLADLSGDEKRKIISLDEMSPYLAKAYVAIEDERFYKHKGVDILRTGHAILSYGISKVTGGSASFGGSTITQQLVKNITQEKERTGIEGILRKVKEWAKAVQVERLVSKNQILELYLNILYVGGNNYHGVELGAEYYFNKSASELSLAECAFMAGINSSPAAYNPFNASDKKMETIKNKTKVVLNKMLEVGYINKEECDSAKSEVDAGLKFEQGVTNGNIYSYHTDAVISQVISQVASEKEISTELATNYVYSSGLKIYSTVDSTIQKHMENVYADTKSYQRSKKNDKGETCYTQSAGVIIDNKTGYVLACVGALGEKTESRGFNRATQATRQTGSAMKPLAAIVPGLEEGIITASTMYDDSYTEFDVGAKEPWTPKNYNYFRGPITIREFIKTSQNIPAAKIVTELTLNKTMDYLEKMGISSLDRKNESMPLSIGGLYHGISPLEMAAAYAMIANDGVYIEPTFYTKVEDSSGNVVLEPKQETRKVMSEGNAYITKSILQEPVKSGGTAAPYCQITGMDVAAKTGTTNSSKDRWLCGFTNYYTAAVWYGYDENLVVSNINSRNPAGLIWSAVMNPIHNSLENSSFKVPSNIVTAKVCKTTGQLATSKCTSTYSEIFVEGNLPEDCKGHGASSYTICKDTGLLANEYCTNKETRTSGSALPKENLKLWNTPSSTSQSEKPTKTCTVHHKQEKTQNTNTKNNTTTNTTTKNNKTNTTTNSQANMTTNTTTNQTNTTTNIQTNTIKNNKTNTTNTTTTNQTNTTTNTSKTN